MHRCSWAPAAIPRPTCSYCCAPRIASAPCANTKRAMRRRWPRCFRRIASESTSRATATGNTPSTACRWKNSWRRRKKGRTGLPACPLPHLISPNVLPARLFFRRGQIANDQVFLYLINYDFVGLPRLAAVELYRLVDVLFLLFGHLFLPPYNYRIPVFLWRRLLRPPRCVAQPARRLE